MVVTTQGKVHSISMHSSHSSKRSIVGRVSGVAAISAIAVFGCVNFESERKRAKTEIKVTSERVLSETYHQEEPPQALGSKPDFASFSDVNEKKKAFFDYLAAGVAIENHRIKGERAKLLRMKELLDESTQIDPELQSFAKRLGKLYNLSVPANGATSDWVNEMLTRVNVLPPALVLTQGANESAWGTSRFATQANNYFGQWCYSKGCGLVPLQRNEGATHEVAKFSSVQESIHRYFMNVNRNAAYKELRIIRQDWESQEKDLLSPEAAKALAQGLISYSERGQDYVNDIQAMIRHNNKYWGNLTQ